MFFLPPNGKKLTLKGMAFNLKGLSEKLAAQRRIAEENDAKRRAEKLGLPYLDLVSVRVPTEIDAMKLVPEEQARQALIVPLQLIGKKLTIAAFNPSAETAREIIDALKKTHEVSVVISSLTGIKHGWNYYQYVPKETKEITGKVEIDDKRILELAHRVASLEDAGKELATFKNPLVSQVLEVILGSALALRASDVHLEPGANDTTLRFRIDGMLHADPTRIDSKTYHAVANRIKLLSKLKLNIKDEPQDGRFTIGLAKTDIEIRTSVIPSEYGETIVLRILDPSGLKVNLEELGFRPDDLAIVTGELKKPNGLILNTGPTGSGKTTTLYAFLKSVWNPEIKIITLEDPIEYHLEGISQTQVDPEANYTFASGLRSVLRQDPDVILIGEIRDAETAEIATNAALTGHLVFSTLHTNDAAGAIPRLIDLKAKPQTLGPALSLVIAQRLVRKLCTACRVPVPLEPDLKNKITGFLAGLPKRVSQTPYTAPSLFTSAGCPVCNATGYKGRTSIFELLLVNDAIEEAIYKNPNEIELKRLAREQSMTTMQEDGLLKVLQGITSLEEVERLTGPIEWQRGAH